MRHHHSHVQTPSESHVTMSLAIVTVGEFGYMTVIVDGHDFPPPAPGVAWGRATFGDLLDAISKDRTRTIRVEVHEFDGSVFTDIIHAAPSQRTPANIQAPATPRRARHRPSHQLIEISGTGFLPGEDITVALSLATTEGASGGRARAVVDLDQLLDYCAEIMLIGRISGVIVTGPLPS